MPRTPPGHDPTSEGGLALAVRAPLRPDLGILLGAHGTGIVVMHVQLVQSDIHRPI